MNAEDMTDNLARRDNLFRTFQIEKFNRNRSVPCVSMTIDIDIEQLQEIKDSINSGSMKNGPITLTHILIKAVSIALKDFPTLYALFDGRKVILSEKIKINVPVSEGSHVEYVVIETPELKSLQDIAGEIREEVGRIRAGIGTFYLRIQKLFLLPKVARSIASDIPAVRIKSTYQYYGNFPITNFGSFGAKSGIPIISEPIIGLICLGTAQQDPNGNREAQSRPGTILPVTIVFDHRPTDGAYCGRFLSSLKHLIENNGQSICK